MLSGDGFLGTGATVGSDLSLIVQIVLYLALCVGIIAQRMRKYRVHDWIQTPVVILNLLFVVFIMIASFRRQQVAALLPQRPGDLYYLVPAVHALLGVTTAALAVYVLLAGHKILPRSIGRLRYFMWTTFALWTITVMFGIVTYIVWYTGDAAAAGAPGGGDAAAEPAAGSESVAGGTSAAEGGAQQVLLQNFNYLPETLTIVAGTEVVWLNQDGAPHNVTFVSGDIVSENFFQGFTFSHRFDQPGVFEMYCSLHGGPGSGMHATITVLEATEENVVQAAEIQAAQPTPNPIPPTATPAPPVPQPPVALIEPPEPEAVVVGIVSFHDVLGHGDQVQISLSGLAEPEAGADYQAWLVQRDDEGRLDLGLISPAEDGLASIVYDEPAQQNLLALYDTFEITIEPEFDDDPTPGPVAYRGEQPPEATATILRITVTAPDTPQGVGYALGGRAQTEELQRHVAALVEAYEFLSIADARRHAEHIVNLLEGSGGEFGGDLDGVHGAQNPGDGFGIIPYIQAMFAAAQEAEQAADATNAVRIHAGHVQLAAGNAQEWAVRLREAALAVIQAASVGDIGPQVEVLTAVSALLLDGEDVNGDGNIAPEEGGLFTAYQHAQYMAAIGVSTAGR